MEIQENTGQGKYRDKFLLFSNPHTICYAECVMKNRQATFLAFIGALCALLAAGCGGGKSSGGVQSGAVAYGENYTSRQIASGSVGPSGASVAGANVDFHATLPATQTVTIQERFYLANRPGGLIGPVYDIHPDGLNFSASPATLCLSYAGTGFSGSSLEIYTGAALDEALPTTVDTAHGTVCATLQHTSPYGIKLAENLKIPAYTIFGNLNTKEKYHYSIQTVAGTDPGKGAYTEYRIYVDCNTKCMEGGDRFFRFFRGGEYDGDMEIIEHGNYPLWSDVGNMKWLHLYSSPGKGIDAGIAYLLALEYVYYFTGDGAAKSTEAIIDQTTNLIQRFINTRPDNPTGYERYISMKRDSGTITVRVEGDGAAARSFTVEESTAKITKTFISNGTQQTATATPSDAAYTALRDDLLEYVNEIIGLDDTPDETAGSSTGEYVRMTPNQELFAINVRDLLTGNGWGNLEAIEGYYRDRNKLMPPGLQATQ
jgi:hypothetical protein